MACYFLKRILITISLIFAVLIFACVYRAYVLIKPCNHKIENIKLEDVIKLDNLMQKRLIDALQIKTITFDFHFKICLVFHHKPFNFYNFLS